MIVSTRVDGFFFWSRRARLVTFLGFVAAGACGHTPTAPSPPPSADRDGLRLSAAISDSSLAPGESAILTLRLENVTAETVSLTFPDSCQVLPFIERPGRGIVVPEGGGWVCATVITELTLPPQGSITQEVQVNGTPDATKERTFVTLPAGEYEAYGQLKHKTRGFRSPAVQFTIK